MNFWGYNGASADYGALTDWKTVFAFIYLFMALTVFSSIVVFCSVVMDISMLMAFAVVIFFGGLFSDYLLGVIVSSTSVRAFAAIFIPDWQMFWVTEVLSNVATLNGGFFWFHLVHAVFQASFFLVLAIILFEKKEVSGTL